MIVTGVWEQIVNGLIEAGELSQMKARSLSKPNNLPEILPIIRHEGVSEERLISVISDVIKLPVLDVEGFDPDVECFKGVIGDDLWLIFKGVAYISNPLSPVLQNEIHTRLEDKYNGRFGIIPLSVQETDLWKGAATVGDRKSTNSDDTENRAKAQLLINKVVEEAARKNASDIHLWPNMRGKIEVRFRMDGSLLPIMTYPLELHSSLEYILMEGMCDEPLKRLSAQGGSFDYEYGKERISFRVERLPVVRNREKVGKITIRQLRQEKNLGKLSDLGLPDEPLHILQNAVSRSSGIVFVTGPTGAGKSTTLFAALRETMSKFPDKSYNTLEDPVEQEVDGVNQVQVDGINVTFAGGLKSLMRSDPDVILVGEVRDEETAQLGVDASMTGHLVLTTLHVTNAHKVVDRLKEMGVLPSVIGESASAFASQRLVKRLCDSCKVPYMLSKVPDELRLYGAILDPNSQGNIQIYKPGGCSKCGNTGYKGRLMIIEVLNVTPEVEDAIVQGKPMSQFRRASIADGSFKDLWHNGLAKVKDGLTTVDQLTAWLRPIEDDRPYLTANVKKITKLTTETL